MLVVDGLTCRFGTKAAVDNASFSIAPGSFVGVIGRSGAGKSTLLRMINRLADPSEGRVLFEGVDVTALRGRELRQWRVDGPRGLTVAGAAAESAPARKRRKRHRVPVSPAAKALAADTCRADLTPTAPGLPLLYSPPPRTPRRPPAIPGPGADAT